MRAAEKRAWHEGAEAMRALCLAVCDEVIDQATRDACTPGRILTGRGAAILIENKIHEIDLRVRAKP